MKKTILNKNKKGNIENEVRSILLDDGHFLFRLKKKRTSSMWSCICTKNNVKTGFVYLQRGITLIALVITIILMLIIAGVVINLTIGENGLFKTAKQAGEEYKIASIKERLEQEILVLQAEKIEKDENLTVEQALIGIEESGTFSEIDLVEEIGIIDGHIIKLGYDLWDNVIIEGIEKDGKTRISVIIEPKGYTNKNVTIEISVKGNNVNITNIEIPAGMTKKENGTYEVEKNGTYLVKVILDNGETLEKEIKINKIDKLPPKDFEITATSTRTGININANTEDNDITEESTNSGVDYYEYYIKKNTDESYTKYNTNEIKSLLSGTYNVYVIAYDKAGNKRQCKNNVEVEIEQWIEIWNEEDLKNIENGLDKNYILMEDIELTQEWIPIGSDSNIFTGKFEGNDHSITKLNINDNIKKYQGLFEYIGASGKVNNLILEGSIIHSPSGNTYLGIVAGYNSGIIENVEVNGVINGKDYCIGGLVGYNDGTINKCKSGVEVIGLNCVGSLVGENMYKGIVKNSMSSGKVRGGDNAGGLIGSNCAGGTIENSYSTGEVSGRGNVGGLVGVNKGEIKNVYTISQIGAFISQAGGLIGLNKSSKIINSYWSTEIAGVDNGDLGSKKTAEEMKKQETYIGFDFENVWVMKEYPELRF